ncbi:MAG: ImmA/IrrE family metallo-endopeptidase [Spirochaetaceae bacterium]|nr:ImmA/IrrE family metallo-endopeptidase [Spirochaetaceae bacterium]
MTRIPEKIAEEVERFVTDFIKKNQCFFPNPIIRDDILHFLETKCTVLYYPLEDDNDGCSLKRVVNEKEEIFVFINTHKPKEKQVFTAAHELGHICGLEESLRSRFPNLFEDRIREDVMNYFAACLLMSKEVFKKEAIRRIKDAEDEDEIAAVFKPIIQLMDVFFVPFKAVVLRLAETGFLKWKDAEILSDSAKFKDLINVFIQTSSSSRLDVPTEKKSIKDFSLLLEIAERESLFSESKLTALHNLMNIPPKTEKLEMPHIDLTIKGFVDEE